jgi:hypothetical protein
MATARHLHHDHVGATEEITIPASGTIPDSEGFLLVADGTNIEWTNDMTEEVQIVFTIGGLSTIIVPGNGGVGGPISESELAVNYQLEDASGNKINGPYCVQWGEGALQVSVTTNTTAFTVAVPASPSLASTGNLQFTADADYDVKWKDNAGNTTVWSPQPAEITPPQGGINPNEPQGALTTAVSPATCQFTPSPNDVPGKVTVLIGSSN